MSANDPLSHLSEAGLLAMTANLDAMHHDVAMPALKESLAEWTDDIKSRGADEAEAEAEAARQLLVGRRRFLTRAAGTAGGVAGIALLAACSSSSSSSASTTTSASASASAVATASGAAASASASGSSTAMAGGEGQALTGDLQLVAVAASLENTAIATYMAAVKSATAGKLGTVPPAVVTFVETAMSQHQDHQKAWNAVLTAAGKQPVTAVDPAIQPTISAAYAKVTTIPELAALALVLENTAGETYQNALAVIKSAAGIKTAASIQPVEFQHAAILTYVLGKYPVPAAFTGLTLARPAPDYHT
jgi:LmbE family N-acetylglucosaminyl deacetylase